jgi:hypothetical protein
MSKEGQKQLKRSIPQRQVTNIDNLCFQVVDAGFFGVYYLCSLLLASEVLLGYGGGTASFFSVVCCEKLQRVYRSMTKYLFA